MLNDGGSYISLYYEVNLKNKKIVKKSDSYVANKGYEYKGKVINTYDSFKKGNVSNPNYKKPYIKTRTNLVYGVGISDLPSID